jgi:hypothetical protein
MRADKNEREKEDSGSVRNSASLEYELDDVPMCGRLLCIPKTSSGCDAARESFKLVDDRAVLLRSGRPVISIRSDCRQLNRIEQ